MYIYTYTRILNTETGRYDIDYGEGETPLIQEVNTQFSGNEAIRIECNGTQVKIYLEEELTSQQETELDTIVSNHS